MDSSSRPKGIREPVQVYLAPDDSLLLNRLVEETQLSKAEILRRGIRSFAAEHGASPMLRFMDETADQDWPASVARKHDEILAESYRSVPKKRR